MLSSWSAVGSVTFSRFVPLNATGFGEPVSFSAVVTVVGAVSAGVSATGLTLIVTLVVFDAVDVGSPGAVSVTVAENVSVSLPSNSTVGVYRSPASTVSTALCRPVNVSVWVPIPNTGLPLVSVPAASASVPWATCNVTVMLSSWSTVGSVTLSRFVPLNGTGFGEPGSFSAVVTVVGAVSTGVSATGATATSSVAVVVALTSPSLSIAIAATVSVTLPSNSLAGVMVSPWRSATECAISVKVPLPLSVTNAPLPVCDSVAPSDSATVTVTESPFPNNWAALLSVIVSALVWSSVV